MHWQAPEKHVKLPRTEKMETKPEVDKNPRKILTRATTGNSIELIKTHQETRIQPEAQSIH